MFDIEYKGGTTVVISTKKAKLVVDPKLSVHGLKDLSTKDVIELATDARFALSSPEAMLTIEGPGEYEVSDFSIKGVAAERHTEAETNKKHATMYRVEVGDVRIAVVGNVNDNLSDDQLEELGVIDLLVVPVGGGGYTLDAVKAAKLARKIDVKAVIPVHYADSAIKYEVPQDGIELFKKEYVGDVEQTAKLKVKSASSLPPTPTMYELTRS